MDRAKPIVLDIVIPEKGVARMVTPANLAPGHYVAELRPVAGPAPRDWSLNHKFGKLGPQPSPLYEPGDFAKVYAEATEQRAKAKAELPGKTVAQVAHAERMYADSNHEKIDPAKLRALLEQQFGLPSLRDEFEKRLTAFGRIDIEVILAAFDAAAKAERP